MTGLGTLVNTAAIAAGGLLGMFLGRFLKENVQKGLLLVNGVCVLFIGMHSALNRMNETDATMMIILAFAAGTLCGELLDLEGKLEKLGEWLKKVSGSQSDGGFVSAFVTASLTVCIGAMAIVGSLQDGIYHDPSTLYAKALLDFIIIFVMAGTMGKGCIFSAVPVFVLQMTVTLLASWIGGWLSDAMLMNISITGNIMIFCVGINLLWPGKLRVANMLPTLIFAALFALL